MKEINWKQDISTLNLQISIKRTSKKKIFVTFGDVFIKVTCPDKGFAKIYDLFKEIDFSSNKNTISYANNMLTLVVQKETKGIWSNLEITDVSREEKKKRRKESIARLDKWNVE